MKTETFDVMTKVGKLEHIEGKITEDVGSNTISLHLNDGKLQFSDLREVARLGLRIYRSAMLLEELERTKGG